MSHLHGIKDVGKEHRDVLTLGHGSNDLLDALDLALLFRAGKLLAQFVQLTYRDMSNLLCT